MFHGRFVHCLFFNFRVVPHTVDPGFYAWKIHTRGGGGGSDTFFPERHQWRKTCNWVGRALTWDRGTSVPSVDLRGDKQKKKKKKKNIVAKTKAKPKANWPSPKGGGVWTPWTPPAYAPDVNSQCVLLLHEIHIGVGVGGRSMPGIRNSTWFIKCRTNQHSEDETQFRMCGTGQDNC